MPITINKIWSNSQNAMRQTYSLVSSNEEEDQLQLYGLLGSKKGRKIWLEFDTIDECATGGSSTVTKYPTERGVLKTDYKYRNPDTVRMTGIISSGGATGLSSILSRMNSWDRQTAIESIRTNLDTLVSGIILLDIQTRNAGRRDNMTLTAYEINETYDNFGSMEVTMQFQEVRQFNNKGKVVRKASDSDTQESGITMTQVAAIGAGILVAGSVIAANKAALL